MTLFASFVRDRLRITLCVITLIALTGLAGCTGMYMGVQGERPTSSGALSDDVTARVDIHTITPEIIYEQQQEAEGSAQLQQARRASVALSEDHAPRPYLVAPGDVLNVTVWNHPELNNPGGQITNEYAGRVVGEDGYFFYPYAGRVKAAGRRVQDIRSELAQRLSAYLTEPQVDVAILQYRGRKVFAVGQFQKPGPIPLTDVPLRITDLVTQAGGFNETADEREAVLTRNGLAQRIDLYALYHKGDLSQNVPLRDGDIVNVSEKRYNKVFVLGEVVKPQSILLPYGRYSLSEALSDAGGLNATTANGSQVYVLRAVPGARPQVWHLNANSPDALVLADGFRLQERDVVFVDAAAVTRWSRVINQLLPSLGGLTSLDNLAN